MTSGCTHFPVARERFHFREGDPVSSRQTVPPGSEVIVMPVDNTNEKQSEEHT